MRIGFVIGRLGRGGAELQLLQLAGRLAARSHVVEVLTYAGASPQDLDFEAAGVSVRAVQAASRPAKVGAVRSWVARFKPALLHGVMKRASSVAILARLGRSSVRVVASDMSTASYGARKPVLWASLVLFRMADHVVTQTEMNRRNLEKLAPWLKGRTSVIRNGVDTDRFCPAPRPAGRDATFRFCVVGSVYAVKNPVRVVRAVDELLKRGLRDFRVDWYGRLGLDPARDDPDATEALRLTAALGVGSHIGFHGETSGVEHVLRKADALLHASVQEGFPNAVVEGMACGLPVVVSRVSDLPLVVAEAQNGFVFDETDPVAIADGMEQMIAVDHHERQQMGARSRELAVRWFGPERYVDDVERLYHRLVNGRP